MIGIHGRHLSFAGGGPGLWRAGHHRLWLGADLGAFAGLGLALAPSGAPGVVD